MSIDNIFDFVSRYLFQFSNRFLIFYWCKYQRFEVLCPFKDVDIVREDTFLPVTNFHKVFKDSYSWSSRAYVYDMCIVVASVSNSTSQFVVLTMFHSVFVILCLHCSYSQILSLFSSQIIAEMIVESLFFHYSNLIMVKLIFSLRRCCFPTSLLVCTSQGHAH